MQARIGALRWAHRPGSRPEAREKRLRIRVEEAIRCSTVHGAYASFEEGIKGTVRVASTDLRDRLSRTT
jgi:predicted amidohydrolase YtcJ